MEVFPDGDPETGKKPGDMVELHRFSGWLSMVESVRDEIEKIRSNRCRSRLLVYRDVPS